MNLSFTALANSFYFAAACCGIPSACGTLLVFSYRLYVLTTPAPSKFPTVKNPDAILLILGGLAGFIEKIARAFSFLGRYVMAGLAILSIAGLFISAALYFTGRGLHAHRPWALTSAAVLVGATLLMAVFSLLATRGLLRVFALSLVITCTCALLTIRRDVKAGAVQPSPLKNMPGLGVR